MSGKPAEVAAVKMEKDSRKRALVLIAVLREMASLPLPAARAAGTAIGVAAWRLKTRPARITAMNIDACFPRLSPRERERLCRRSLIETGRLIAETGFAWYGKAEAMARRVRTVEGGELIDKPSPGGTVILMPHFGNWEILAYVFRRSAVTCLYAPPRVPGLEEEMIRARERWGATMVAADHRGLRAVKATLARRGVVGILPDQTPAPEAGVSAPFFGRAAMTMTLVHRLLTEQTRVVLATAQRTPAGFDVRVALADERIRDKDATVSAAAMNADIEAAVLREPAQYQWEYNRFRCPVDRI